MNLKSLAQIFFLKTNQDSGIVLLGTALNIIAGGLFFILTPRLLGPVNYGLFSTVIATGLLATSIANFGIDTGILRFMSTSSENKNKYLSLAFKSYIILGLSVSILGIITSSLIAQLLNQPQISFLLKIAFSSTIFLLLSNFYTAALQAKKEFFKASVVNISSNVARIVILLILSVTVTISLNLITVLFFFITIISALCGRIFLPFKFEKNSKEDFTRFFRFNIFISASLIVSSIPFDNYLLLKIAGPLATGLYAAPLKFLTFGYQFGGNFSKVIATDLTQAKNIKDAFISAKKTTPVLWFFILGLVILFIFSKPINNLFFGESFRDSVVIMRILILGFAFFFLSILPSSIILYHFGKSEISFLITLIKYIFYIAMLYFFIPLYKANGAAWAFSLSELFSFVLMLIFVFKKYVADEN